MKKVCLTSLLLHILILSLSPEMYCGKKMNCQIDLLKNHSHVIPALVELWHESLGRVWTPEIPLDRVEKRFFEHLNDASLPLTYVAFIDEIPVGMCSLRMSDGIRQELCPWLSSLAVSPRYQNRGIARALIKAVKDKAKELGFNKIYLYTFDPTLPAFYEKLGWQIIGVDKFKNNEVIVMEICL